MSAFAIHLLNSIILKPAPSEISLFYLVSVAEKVGFGMIFLETLKIGGTSFVDLLCILSCVCYVFVHVCLYMLCGHLLGKG